MIQINSRAQLFEFAADHGLRPDWHEPDEQGINARIVGTHLDNAMGSTMETIPRDDPSNPHGEFNVVLRRSVIDDETWAETFEDIAVVNLATLLAWAAEPEAL